MLTPGNTSPCHHSLLLFAKRRESQHAGIAQQLSVRALIGYRINWYDKGSADFSDTPTSLQSIMARLDDWLQGYPEKPQVINPSLTEQDFADLWNDIQYKNFRNFINKYRKWIDDAIEEQDEYESLKKWRKVFGDDFAKGRNVEKVEESIVQKTRSLLLASAAHADDLVNTVIEFGINILPVSFQDPPHKQLPSWPLARYVSRNVQVSAEFAMSKHGRRRKIRSGETLPNSGGLWFHVRVNKFQEVPPDCFVRWRITNTGVYAMSIKQGRGGFEKPSDGNSRWEELAYRGVHMAEAFIIRTVDQVVVAFSEPFYVVIQ